MKINRPAYTEEEIISGCVQNRRKFQEILYRQYFDRMYTMCMKHTRHSERSMEIVNSGFLKVFMQIGSFNGQGKLYSWIRTIVYRTMADWYRENKQYMRFISLDEPGELHDSGYNTPADNMNEHDITVLLNGLPERLCEVFRLYALEGYSHREIGHRLGISEGTSKWHLSEARKRLKTMLEEGQMVNNATKNRI